MKNLNEYYNILGVPKNASFKEIKQAYRKLSLQYHPDRNSGNDSQKFKKITEAYQYLKVQRKKETQKSKKNAGAAHAEFWNYYDKRTKEDFNFHRRDFAQFRRGFEENIQHPTPNREKPISQKSTHLILYSGLAVVAIWIILTEILK